jgi:SAM-dependent methyltransferase
VPVAAEAVVECLYGADWRRPKPGFSWVLARTDAAVEGEVAEAERTKVYWANFYAHHSYTSGSSFFEFVDGREDTPATVVDIGCGDGRDALAFGGSGRRVLGLDQSPVGIDHATARAAKAHLEDTVSFRECDVADTAALGEALQHAMDPTDGPVLYYLRFFLHAIDESTQRGLLDAIGTHARPGDSFAAEFRTDKDEPNTKVHRGHYRRYQNAEAFLDDLRARGWEVTHQEEGTGLSPYGEEDPVLCRVVAHRRSHPV